MIIIKGLAVVGASTLIAGATVYAAAKLGLIPAD